MKKLYIGTNTKMYKTISQSLIHIAETGHLVSSIPKDLLELFIIPPFTALESARKVADTHGILLGAQNMSWEDEGQFTGEISPVMLKEVGVRVIEIGHSERRHILGETDEMENRKVRSALRHGLTPLLCIGETHPQKKLGISDETLRIQIKTGLNNVSGEEAHKLWIAYEPVWAIGVNGIPASKEYAGEKHGVIRQTLSELYGKEIAAAIPLLYGGSVNNKNAAELIRVRDIDGLFIGRSAWDAENFNAIIRDVLPIFQQKNT